MSLGPGEAVPVVVPGDDAAEDDAELVADASHVAPRWPWHSASVEVEVAYSLSYRLVLCVAFRMQESHTDVADNVAEASNMVLDNLSLLHSDYNNLHQLAMLPASVLRVNSA